MWCYISSNLTQIHFDCYSTFIHVEYILCSRPLECKASCQTIKINIHPSTTKDSDIAELLATWKYLPRASRNNEYRGSGLPSGCPGRRAVSSRSLPWWDMLRRWVDGCCVSLSGSLLATSSATSPDELARPVSLRNACPSVFAWNGDAAGRPVGVLGELRAGSPARPSVSSATVRDAVPDDLTLTASLPTDSVARWLVLFTSHPTFDTIPAPSSDAILVSWATSRTRRYYAAADWWSRLPAAARADRHSPASTPPSGGHASRRGGSISMREYFYPPESSISKPAFSAKLFDFYRHAGDDTPRLTCEGQRCGNRMSLPTRISRCPESAARERTSCLVEQMCQCTKSKFPLAKSNTFSLASLFIWLYFSGTMLIFESLTSPTAYKFRDLKF